MHMYFNIFRYFTQFVFQLLHIKVLCGLRNKDTSWTGEALEFSMRQMVIFWSSMESILFSSHIWIEKILNFKGIKLFLVLPFPGIPWLERTNNNFGSSMQSILFSSPLWIFWIFFFGEILNFKGKNYF